MSALVAALLAALVALVAASRVDMLLIRDFLIVQLEAPLAYLSDRRVPALLDITT